MNSSNNLHKFAVIALLTATALIVCSNGVFAAETMIYGRVSTSLRVTKADGEPTKVDMSMKGHAGGYALRSTSTRISLPRFGLSRVLIQTMEGCQEPVAAILTR